MRFAEFFHADSFAVFDFVFAFSFEFKIGQRKRVYDNHTHSFFGRSPGSARTIRGMVHSIKREEFVLNASLESIPSLAIIFKYIIPQISSLLIVSTALSIPGFIMSETTLSYLGLGIADPSVSWVR